MLAFIAHQPFTFALVAAAALALGLAALGVRVIGEHEAGLVIKRLGHPLPPGRLIATGGEAGYQADLLPPGWHFPLWRWKYKVERVPLVTVPPGQIACVVANDGRPVPSEHVLGRDVPCDRFQDARAFLEGGGERGRHVDALELAAQVAGGQHLGGTVGTDGSRDGGTVSTDEHLDGVGDLTGLGQHLEGDRSNAVLVGLGVDPNLGKSHVFVSFLW